MGYETIMHIGEVAQSIDADEDRHYFRLVASVDIAKADYDGPVHALAQDVLGTPVYLYAANGNDRLTEDRYGRGLVAIDAPAVIAALKKEIPENNPYRRYVIALALLESAVGNFRRLQVVFYGH